jgi:hypothetical protein
METATNSMENHADIAIFCNRVPHKTVLDVFMNNAGETGYIIQAK